MEASPKFYALLAWLLLSSWNFGFHISALNSPQSVIVCSTSRVSTSRSQAGWVSSCLDITSAQFGLVTAAYTFGGLVGCLLAPMLLRGRTQKVSLVACAALVALGGLIQALASRLGLAIAGRAVTGFGAALAISVIPTALSVVAPDTIRGSIGVLHQLSICTGILSAQALGLVLSKPTVWRWIPLASSGISLVQIITSLAVPSPDSPNLVTAKTASPEEEEGLLPSNGEDGSSPVAPAPAENEATPSIGVWELLTDADMRRGVAVTLGAMLLQQAAGINAVMYYSTDILSGSMPGNARLLAFLITVFNVAMTFPPILLIERLGRKSLLLLSSSCMALASLALAYGLNHHQSLISATAVFAFVGSFAFGLGPVPFILTGELVPPKARSTLSSISLVVNFSSNLVIGIVFLPLRDALSSHVPGVPQERAGEGNIFYIFAAFSVVGALGLARGYRAG